MPKDEEERKPDLTAPDEALEQRVKDMLEPEPAQKPGQVAGRDVESDESESSNQSSGKKVEIKFDDPTELATEATTTSSDHDLDEDSSSENIINLDEAETEAGQALLASLQTEEETEAEAETEQLQAKADGKSPPQASSPAETAVAQPAGDNDSISQPITPADGLFNDEVTVQAVEDIIAKDSDRLIASEDAQRQELADKTQPKSPWLLAWWHNRWTRRLVFLGLLLAVVAAWALPVSRYAMLNALGVRSRASVVVIDQGTLQPLKNVEVMIGGESAQTNDEGEAQLQDLKLGESLLTIQRRAFATHEQSITVGWGSNPLGEFRLKPTGIQYVFMVSDYASEQPLHKVEAEYQGASAFSDESGELILTLDDIDEDEVSINIQLNGYRTETVVARTDNDQPISVAMVPARPHVFVSNRSGTFDVYKIDADGKNETLLLAGTGSERGDMNIAAHPRRDMVAVVSTRDAERNSQGHLLNTLTVVDVKDGEARRLVVSERVQVIGWVDNFLLYVHVREGSQSTDADRHRLVKYDYERHFTTEIASTNFFNAVYIVGDTVYYAPSSNHRTDYDQAQLYARKVGSDNSQVVLNREVWSMFRSSYGKLTLSSQDQWFWLDLNSGQIEELPGQPANPTDRLFADNTSRSHAAWIELRDGKRVILLRTPQDSKETVLHSASGATYPMRWLNDSTLVFRVVTDQETADYVISRHGGPAKKVRDVSNISATDQWYYY